MEPESYKVDVLYFINPYLIWVEKKDLESDNADHCFEQIGVYGVLPLEMTMDPIEDTLNSKRSSDWMPAASVLMTNLFADAVEVSFCPVHIEHRTTIFDDNKHKYGEIIIKKPNGKYRLLSKLLVKSGVAIYNENAFQVELSSGKIKTKLSQKTISDIVKQLEKKHKKQVTKQMQVFHTAQHLESALTIQNLEAHNKRTKTKTNKLDEDMLQRKLDDLQLCKNVEEQSVGRATKKQEKESDSNSLLLKKKLKFLRCQQDDNAPDVANYFIKQRLEDLNALQKPPKDMQETIQETTKTEESHHFDDQMHQKLNSIDIDFVEKQNFNVFIADDTIKEVKTNDKSFESNTIEEDRPKRVKKRTINKSCKIPEYDVYKETRVAYGPPGTNLTVLPCKIVAKDDFIEKYERTAPEDKEERIPMKKEKEDIFEQEDSDVEIEGAKFQVPEKPICEKPKPKSVSETILDTNSDIDVRKSVFNNPSVKVSLQPQDLPKDITQIIAHKSEEYQRDQTSKQQTPSSSLLKRKLRTNSDIDVRKSVFNNPIVNISLKPQDLSINVPQAVAHKSEESQHHQISKQQTSSSSLLKRKLRIHKENVSKILNSPTTSDTSNKDSSTSVEDDRFRNHKIDDNKNSSSQNLDSDDDSLSEVIEKLNSEYKPFASSKKKEEVVSHTQVVTKTKNHVNPFKNIDANISKFVEKLVTPVLMVHSKMGKRFQPTFKLGDVHFNTHIKIILKNMGIEHPMMLQTITWNSILRGYSTFMISPKMSGKTMGYLPAVCRLVADRDSLIDGAGPMSIIVCATSNSVSEVEMLAKLFFGSKERVLAIYSGMNELHIATSLLNGCDMLICTPAILVRLMQADFGVDLRRLTSFVLDDCERLAEVFGNEIKFFLFKIKEMLKNRVQKEVKVQYILSSRVWCDFIEPLAKRAPDAVICIGAFQECVLYSKANTTASFVTEENKIKSVLDFLKDVDTTKRTVVVCRTDEEVEELEKALTEAKYVVFASNSEMTIQNLYNLSCSWDDYHEPVIGPILVCVDGNLAHLNVTDAHYLIHYSLPSLFSSFCKRFSALNENYPSIFKADSKDVKIKILLDDSSVEQLPKIMHFIKRCTTEVPTVLDEICEQILEEKDKMKAKRLVPICDNLLTLGECPEFWNCQERHAVVKEFDEPHDWVPRHGMVSFKILHYHTAVLYSARLLANTTSGQTMKYPQNYNMLSMKISMYFGRESNRRLHGVPEVGDICAVSKKQNFFVRCQVVKILKLYQNGKPSDVLVKLIDEEKLEITRDIYLYHLPEELKTTQTHVVHVRLANLQPKDKDITFSALAKNQLQKITDGEEDLYMRGQIALTIGNCIILESIEACRDLSTLSKTVVLHDFKKLLLEDHALLNEEHLQRLNKLCLEGGMDVSDEKTAKATDAPQPLKKLPKPQWAHLEKDDLSAVIFASAEDPSTFFVRLGKFEDSCTVLVKDIQIYAAQNTEKLLSVSEGDIVLAKLPDDDMFERARIDEIINDDKVKCFFVDHGDWREVTKQNVIPISEKLVTQLPFQAIECRLIGVKPPGENWTEFVTNWFTNCFEDNAGNLKQIYAKYCTKEKAQYTDGHKYGVVLIDTNSAQDVIINQLIMEVNLAQEKESEIGYLNVIEFKSEPVEIPKELSDEEEVDDSWERVSKASKSSSTNDDLVQPNISLNDLFPKKPIRSVPLIGSDESETSEDKWQVNMTEDFMAMFKPVSKQNTTDFLHSNQPAIKNTDSKSRSEVNGNQKPCKNQSSQDQSSDNSSSQKLSSTSDILVVPSPNIKELDSDDYSSPESSLLTTKTIEKQNLIKEIAIKRKSKETATPTVANIPTPEKEPELLRKPKLLWHQKKRNVTVKILLIGVNEYDLIIEERQLKFHAMANDTEYSFDLQLYGIIDTKSATHSNKGQYIRVNLYKVMDRNWLTLTKSSGLKKWIVYDVDAIDVESSDEDDNDISKDFIKSMCTEENNTDSEEEDFIDDVNFGYSR